MLRILYHHLTASNPNTQCHRLISCPMVIQTLVLLFLSFSQLLIFDQYLRLILTSRVYEVLDETPLTHAVNISNRLECKVLLKREDLLPVFSFKLRGAYNKMAHIDPHLRWKGVIACSAGEYACQMILGQVLLRFYRKPRPGCRILSTETEDSSDHCDAFRHACHQASEC